MRLFNDAGRLVKMTLPPHAAEIQPAFAEQVATAEQFEAELETALAEEASAAHALEDEQRDARARRAKAIREGKPEPKDASAKARERLEQAQRRAEDLRFVVDEQARAVPEHFDRDAFIAASTKRRDEELALLQEKVDALLEQRAIVAEWDATIVWGDRFPLAKTLSWTPSSGHVWVGRERLTWQLVADALCRDADPELRFVDPTAPKTMQQEVARIRREGPSGPGVVVDGALVHVPAGDAA